MQPARTPLQAFAGMGPTRQSNDINDLRPCTLVMYRLRCIGGKHLNMPTAHGAGQLAREVRGLPVGVGIL